MNKEQPRIAKNRAIFATLSLVGRASTNGLHYFSNRINIPINGDNTAQNGER